jgi:hypothetical protein
MLRLGWFASISLNRSFLGVKLRNGDAGCRIQYSSFVQGFSGMTPFSVVSRQ